MINQKPACFIPLFLSLHFLVDVTFDPADVVACFSVVQYGGEGEGIHPSRPSTTSPVEVERLNL